MTAQTKLQLLAYVAEDIADLKYRKSRLEFDLERTIRALAEKEQQAEEIRKELRREGTDE